MQRLVWLDLETTGLNPRAEEILELAIVVTDANLEELATFTSLVRFNDSTPERVDPFVRKMHTDNGLWDELADGDAPRRYEVEANALAFLDAHAPREPGAKNIGPMCGSSVHFDRAFLREHMPQLEQRFHYRNLDTSGFGIACELWLPDVFANRPSDSKAHRALDDTRHSIALMRYYRDTFFVPMRTLEYPPPSQETLEQVNAALRRTGYVPAQ